MTWKEYFTNRLKELQKIWNEEGVAIYDEWMRIKEYDDRYVVSIDYTGGELEIDKDNIENVVKVLDAIITTARFWKELAEHYESKYDELKQELKQKQEQEQEQEQKGGDEPPF